MSQMLNYMEQRLAEMVAGTPLPIPLNWTLAPLSAYTESGVTEITSAGIDRFNVPMSLANWAGTQGDGTTLASSGTSHITSNNIAIDLGTATGSATVVALGFFDSSSGGNCWMVWDLETPLSVSSGNHVTIAPGVVRFALGVVGGLSDYLCNKLVDQLFRDQDYTFPATLYNALYTSAPTNAGGGSEVGGGVGYGRAAIPSSNWAATTGRAGNVSAVTHPGVAADWGTVNAHGLKDAATAGNLLFWNGITPMTVAAGSAPPSFAANALGITFA